MQFIAVSRRRTDAFPAEAFAPELIAAEQQRVRELYSVGILRSIWRRKDMPGAVLLLETRSEDEARTAIDSLPLAQRGMLEIIAFTQLEPYPGLGA